MDRKNQNSILEGIVFGMILGIATVYIISLLISVIKGNGNYYPVAPGLAEELGSELRAVAVQTLCAMLLGITLVFAGRVMRADNGRYLAKRVCHLCMIVPVFAVMFYFLYLRWQPHARRGLIAGCASYVGIMIVYYAADYASMRRNVREMNDRLKDLR